MLVEKLSMLRKISFIIICLFAVVMTGCGTSDQEGKDLSYYEKGNAAFYSLKENGTLTSYDERYDRNKLTAAHSKLPYGTKVKVTNLNKGRNVVVTINDRRVLKSGCIIKLSEKAASELATSSDKNHLFSIEITKWG